MAIFTLGHSTLTADEFVTAAKGIDVIVDVRSHPGSKKVPHFNRSEMSQWLPENGLRYEWWPGLGGWSDRHYKDRELTNRMCQVGVDLSAYASGSFPRQRIGISRQTPVPGLDSQTLETTKPQWTNMGLWDYQWFMTLDEFQTSIDSLITRFSSSPPPNCALVCSESLYWKCHRSMIADYLHWRGVPSYHLPSRPPKRPTTRRFKPHAEAIGNRLQRYEPEVIRTWEEWWSD